MLNDDLSNLRRVVAADGTALEIDDALLPLIARADPCIVAPILKLLNETGDQDGMWSMLHTAESFEGPAYVAGLLRALPELIKTCFGWAEVLMIRILNSNADSAELIHQLRDASTPTKEVVSAICERINDHPDFHAKTAPVIAVTMV